MTAVNHAAAGAAIALAINKPILAIPLAFLSHFVLDALPHYGYQRAGYGEALKHKMTNYYLMFAIAGLAALVWVMWGLSWSVFIAAIVAVSPDFMWPYRYFLFERKGLKPPGGKITAFHQWVQWCEYPWGLAVEIVLAIGLIVLVRQLR